MKWIAISGSWRKSNSELVRDVQHSVKEIMERGDGIVTGGALGVDFVATEEALKHNKTADRIQIILPSTLDIFAAHFRKRASERVITAEQAEILIDLLRNVQSRRRESLVELGYTALNEKSYYARNTEVLERSDELLAFQVNSSLGTQDTIDKARNQGMPVTLKQYTIE